MKRHKLRSGVKWQGALMQKGVKQMNIKGWACLHNTDYTRPTSDKLCLPKQTFPCGKVCTLEESMLKDAFYTSKGLDHICTVVVQVPQLAIMALVCPPEWILFQDLQKNNKIEVFPYKKNNTLATMSNFFVL
jgi:hypothetical protein